MTATPEKKHTGRNIGIVVVVVILAFFAYATISGTSANKVNITGANLQISYTNGGTYLGPSSQALSGTISVNGGDQITYTITFTTSAWLFTHSINSISMGTSGFTLISVSPNLPYTLSPSSSVAITLTIQTPNANYNGPITILLSTS
jgi:hypothetical protein